MPAEDLITVTFCSTPGVLVQEQPLASLNQYQPGELFPVRKPNAYKGQSHLPGLFWMSKLARLVSYESRLEMVVLKKLDFDSDLCEVLPQPCVLHFSSKGKRYRHIPDYLVWRPGVSPQLINVKPRKYVEAERNERAFSACERACEQIGWTYSTQSEPPRVLLANLNWLAGYRRQPPAFSQYARVLAERAWQPVSIAKLLDRVGPSALVRPVLFHLLWTRKLEFDIGRTLSDSSTVALVMQNGATVND